MDQAEPPGELARIREQLGDARRALEHSEALRHASNERETALAGELQHRVRNMLGIIRSIFSRTMETAASLEDAADHFRGRLDTVARYQAHFVRHPGGTVDLETLFRDELLNFGFSDGEQITIEGPRVRLPYETAEAIGLAVHELATNSVKFGALSGDDARLAVRWSVGAEMPERLSIEWTESGVPVLAVAPLRMGFGREYIEQALPYQIDATTSFELRPGGITCRISLFPGSQAERA
jgi:two-component sensor histidine kinase